MCSASRASRAIDDLLSHCVQRPQEVVLHGGDAELQAQQGLSARGCMIIAPAVSSMQARQLHRQSKQRQALMQSSQGM